MRTWFWLCLICTFPLLAQDGRFNQFGEEEYNGIQRKVLKLSLGYGQENPPEDKVGLLLGRFEYLVTDYFGVRGEAGYPVTVPLADYWYIPLTLGGNIHIFPRSPVDVYLGADGGFVYLNIPNWGEGLFSRTSFHSGLSWYFWGVFFLEAELRYNIQHFARNNPKNLSSVGWNVQMGFYF